MSRDEPTWSAPVRYAEADQQGVVFNAHYLTYCDEAAGALFVRRGLPGFADDVRLATTTLTWSGPARWHDRVDVYARCTRIGRTSLVIRFDLLASGRECATVETVYVHTDKSGRPVPVPEHVRAALA